MAYARLFYLGGGIEIPKGTVRYPFPLAASSRRLFPALFNLPESKNGPVFFQPQAYRLHQLNTPDQPAWEERRTEGSRPYRPGIRTSGHTLGAGVRAGADLGGQTPKPRHGAPRKVCL